MHRDPHSRCEDCGTLLSLDYPYEFCPKCWKQRYGAPPGYNRSEFFLAARNLAGAPPNQTNRMNTNHTSSLQAVGAIH